MKIFAIPYYKLYRPNYSKKRTSAYLDALLLLHILTIIRYIAGYT